MTNLELQRLRDLPIEQVAERLGLAVKHHKSLCPFHDDHAPSLSFNRGKNTYRCFVCGAHGGTIDLVMDYQHMDFIPATKWLADEHNIITMRQPTPPPQGRSGEGLFDASRYERFFEHPFLNEAACHFLYEERHLDPRVVRWCRLTSWTDKHGIPWLQIPYYDKEGKLIGIQNRNLNYAQPSPPSGEVGKMTPRFRFPTGSRCSIYNLPVLNLLRPDEPLYITEGSSDCWAMLSSGHKAIAIPSATLLNPNDIGILTSLPQLLGTTFHMYPDRDEPGERLFLQLKQYLPDIVHHQLPIGCKDYSDYYTSRSTTTPTTDNNQPPPPAFYRSTEVSAPLD